MEKKENGEKKVLIQNACNTESVVTKTGKSFSKILRYSSAKLQNFEGDLTAKLFYNKYKKIHFKKRKYTHIS